MSIRVIFGNSNLESPICPQLIETRLLLANLGNSRLHTSSIGALQGLYKGYRKKLGFGALGGSRGAIFTSKFHQRVSHKLRRIILPHFGLVAFRLHSPEIKQVIVFMIFEPSGHVHDSHNQLFLTLETPNCFKKYKKNTKPFRNIFCWKFAKSWTSTNSENWERRVPINP